MIELIFKQTLAGIWPLLWKFGLAGFIVICCLAWAWFMPIFKRTALALAGAVVITTAAYTVGIKNGADRVKAQWDWTLELEAKQGEQIRKDAERDVAAEPAAVVRDDKWNRDGWKDGKRPPG